MITGFVIETRRGFFAANVRIAGYSFPHSFGSLVAADCYPSRKLAENRAAKYHLTQAPFHASIHEVEIDDKGEMSLKQ